MKTTSLIFLVALASSFLFIRAQQVPSPVNPQEPVDTVINYAVEARAIIDQKCFGCHNPEAKNEKAKKKFMWDELPKSARQNQLKVMNDLLEVLNEGKMPPEKFLQFKPEAKLTEAESSTLWAWAGANAKKLNQ